MSGNESKRVIGGPDEAGRAGVHEAVGRWVAAPALRTLAERFGFAWPEDVSLTALVRGLEIWSRDVWDFRHGKERWDAAELEADVATKTAVMDAAAELGLVGTSIPSLAPADAVIILGGGFLTPLYRSRHAAAAAEALGCSRIISLGTGRPLAGEREVALSAEYAPGASTEFDLMEAAARSAFGLSEPASVEQGVAPGSGEEQHRAWQHSLILGDGITLEVLRAPSTDPSRRANTRDTYRFLIERLDLGVSPRVAIATTSIFVPFQHFDALNILGEITTANVETTGFDVMTGPNPATPSNLLQEVRSGIFSAMVALEAHA